jgi:hypothetical protein
MCVDCKSGELLQNGVEQRKCGRYQSVEGTGNALTEQRPLLVVSEKRRQLAGSVTSERTWGGRWVPAAGQTPLHHMPI